MSIQSKLPRLPLRQAQTHSDLTLVLFRLMLPYHVSLRRTNGYVDRAPANTASKIRNGPTGASVQHFVRQHFAVSIIVRTVFAICSFVVANVILLIGAKGLEISHSMDFAN